MRRFFPLLLVLTVGPAFADDCGDLAQRFAADRDALKIGELDDLKTCISDLEHDKASGLSKPTQARGPAAAAEVVSEPVSVPVSEPVSAPVSEPVSGPVSEPVSNPVSSSSP